MHPIKQQYAEEVYQIIAQYCEKNFLDKNKNNKALSSVLGITDDEAQKLINKILIALPDCFFYMAKPLCLNEMLRFIAQQYLLFQVQENIDDVLFPILLINFINSLVEDIMLRYYSPV